MWRPTMKIGRVRKSTYTADEVVAVIGYDPCIARDKMTRNLNYAQKRNHLIAAGVSAHSRGVSRLSKLVSPC